MPEEPVDHPKHLLALDGLRGGAVIIVVLLHAHFLSGGFIGVDIFFVLSGFLITSFMLKEFELSRTLDLYLFYVKRILRLMPALVLCVLGYIFVSKYSGVNSEKYWPPSLAALTFTINWLSAYGIVGDSPLGHTWSLAIEMQFYMIWPIVALFLFRIRNVRTIYMLLAIAIVASVGWRCYLTFRYGGASVDRTYRGLDTRLDGLLVGAFAALLTSRGVKFTSSITVIASGLFLAFVILYVPAGKLWIHGWGLTLVAMCSAYIVCFVSQNKESYLSYLLSVKPIVYTGRISYGIYLYHFPIIKGFESRGISHAGSIGSILAFFVAAVSYHLVEVRFLALKPARSLQADGTIVSIDGRTMSNRGSLP